VPARYFISISRGIFLKGIGLTYLWPDIAMLTVFTLLLMWFCIRSFKKRID
jgi:ABC-2 type transport system permease protein